MKRKLHPTRILFICLLIISGMNLQAQRQTVSGTVTSGDDGVPLSGVSVVLQGASSGTITDENGKYSLSIPGPKSKIVFSYTGFVSQTVEAGNRAVINIAFVKDTKQLSDVVVTIIN